MKEKTNFLMKENIKLFILSFLGTFSPIINILVTVGLLIVIDFIVGLYRAIYLKETITSRKMSNSIGKILLYNLFVISLWGLEYHIMDNLLPITKVGAMFVALVEIKSISESLEKIFKINFFIKIMNAIKRGENGMKSEI